MSAGPSLMLPLRLPRECLRLLLRGGSLRNSSTTVLYRAEGWPLGTIGNKCLMGASSGKSAIPCILESAGGAGGVRGLPYRRCREQGVVVLLHTLEGPVGDAEIVRLASELVFVDLGDNRSELNESDGEVMKVQSRTGV